MEDTRITFETAKLAKEKGFNERVHYFYKVKSENDIELYGCTKKQLVGFKGYTPIYHKVRDYHTNKEKLNSSSFGRTTTIVRQRRNIDNLGYFDTSAMYSSHSRFTTVSGTFYIGLYFPQT